MQARDALPDSAAPLPAEAFWSKVLADERPQEKVIRKTRDQV